MALYYHVSFRTSKMEILFTTLAVFFGPDIILKINIYMVLDVKNILSGDSLQVQMPRGKIFWQQ